MNELEINDSVFEKIKHIDKEGNEFWLARELQKVLDYTEWRKFEGVINKAIEACQCSNYVALDHFVGADKMVDIGSKTIRNVGDYKLSRYACYLIAQNGETANDIAKRKGLRYREDILDNMGSAELIANLFRISQTEEKLKKDGIISEINANKTHNKIGKIVRKAIKEAGGTMPEELPTPNKSLKELDKENNSKLISNKV